VGSTTSLAACITDIGIPEETFLKDFDTLLEGSLKGSTAANPVKVSIADMEKFLNCIYYGVKVDF
jgi:alcohol dehydrogenase class IV